MFQTSSRKWIGIAAALIAAWLSAQYLMPILTPFLLAFLLALAAEPLVKVFCKQMHLPRAVATGIGVTMAIGLLILLIMVLGALVVRELSTLAGVVPDLADTALQGMNALEGWMVRMASKTPESIRPVLTRSVENFFSGGTSLLDRISTKLISMASGVVSKLPDSAFGIGTWLIACFMISAKLPKIRQWIHNHLPVKWHETYFPALKNIRKTVSGWFLAQLKLMGITFLVLLAGFFVLQIRHGFIWAFLISLVDALPILGTGTVLFPWSLVCFIQGNTVQGIGILGIYLTATLARSTLGPRFIGKHLGLDPLITLVAMYAGYQISGFLGMLLAPLLAVTAAQLFLQPKNR